MTCQNEVKMSSEAPEAGKRPGSKPFLGRRSAPEICFAPLFTTSQFGILFCINTFRRSRDSASLR